MVRSHLEALIVPGCYDLSFDNVAGMPLGLGDYANARRNLSPPFVQGGTTPAIAVRTGHPLLQPRLDGRPTIKNAPDAAPLPEKPGAVGQLHRVSNSGAK